MVELTEMSGAKMVIECLKRLDINTVFGYPGGAILPIYDALYQSGLRHILTRHEQAAIHAAEGYARATGKVGTVMATSGPGATNLVTGIANAYLDSTPLVVITAQVMTGMLGRDAFQEVDFVGITMPVTKYSYQVRNAADLPHVLVEAYHIASTGRPGPVVIDIPKDVANQVANFDFQEKVDLRGYRPQTEPDPNQIKNISQVISEAKRPILFIGGGVISAEASKEVRMFARKSGIPVVSTLMGLGAYLPDDPLFLGMLGMHGTYAANLAVHECDLLIACGVRFDDRVTGKLEEFSPNSKRIHIDIDQSEIGKNVPVDYPLVCDVKKALQALEVEPQPHYSSWVRKVQELKDQHPLTFRQEDGFGLKPQYVIDLLSRMTNGETIVTTEVGQHQMWAAQFYKAKEPRTFITSGGLGTMGFGFPSAIGAKLGKPDTTVVCLAGDASFQMNIQELQTISQLNIPVKVFVMNNGFAGMVRQWQEMFFGNRLSESKVGAPDFVRVAEAYNIKALRATTPAEAEKAMEEALAYPGPIVIDFVVDESENVFPMVPPGKGNHELIVKGWDA